jgi:TonB family protein
MKLVPILRVQTYFALTFCTCFVLWISPIPLVAQQRTASIGAAAIDTKGLRYLESDYRGRPTPWWEDRIKFPQPDYPIEEREKYHEGEGLFRLSLDPRTGLVTNVIVVKSTGWPLLNKSAVLAFRQWRWRPGKWKEIDVPVHFEMNRKGQGHMFTEG